MFTKKVKPRNIRRIKFELSVAKARHVEIGAGHLKKPSHASIPPKNYYGTNSESSYG